MANRKTWNDEEFIEMIKICFTKSEVLRKFGLVATGSNFKTFDSAVRKLNIDTSHFTGEGHLKNKTHNWGKKIPIKEILIENSFYSSNTFLKKRLIKENLIEFKCQMCGITEWLGRSAPLELDHINGVNNDHRIENLRLLCPNCHSFTPTFAGRNIKSKYDKPSLLKTKGHQNQQRLIKEKITYHCIDCKCQVNSNLTKRCKNCNLIYLKSNPYNWPPKREAKIKWPSKEELEKLIWEKPMSILCKELGVSDRAIAKKIKNYGIKKPDMGYWAKLKSKI